MKVKSISQGQSIIKKLVNILIVAILSISLHDFLKRASVFISNLLILDNSKIDGLENTIRFGSGLLIKNTIFFLSLLAISIFLIKIILKISLREAGFNLYNRGLSLKITKSFLSIVLFIVIGVVIIGLKYIDGFENYILSWSQPSLVDELSKQFIVTILAPIAEETMYRAFVITFLIREISGNINFLKFSVPISAIVGALIFMIIHIDFTLYPFAINYVDYLQLIYTFIFGVIWGTAYIKTKSLLSPVLCHSGSNFIMSSLGFIAAFFI